MFVQHVGAIEDAGDEVINEDALADVRVVSPTTSNFLCSGLVPIPSDLSIDLSASSV